MGNLNTIGSGRTMKTRHGTTTRLPEGEESESPVFGAPAPPTVERIRQLSGDADEPRVHERPLPTPIAKLWLPLHNYFRW
jgi:hypothetical protein